MKKWAAFLAIVMLGGAIFSAPQTQLISDDENLTVFEVRWDEPKFVPVSGDTVRIILDGCGPRGEDGAPQLVGRAFNIAVPRDSRVSVRIDEVQWSEWMGYVPAPMPEKWSERGTFTPEKYSHPAGGGIKIAYDQIWRGVRVVGVDIVPIEYSPGKGIRYMKSAVVSVEHPGSAPIYDLHHYHPVMGQFYRATLVNPEAAIPKRTFSYSEWSPDSGAELLVITNSTFYEHAQPWIDWKLLMGMPTIVALTDTIGTSVEDIRNFVYNAYHNWDIAPLYLLIIGDTEQIPTYTDYTYVIDDQYYCLVDGDDIFPDILPGRISVDNNNQLDVFVAKLLNYEATPDTIDRWYLRGIGVVRRDDCDYLGPVDSSYLAAVNYAMEACSAAGFYSTPVFVNCEGVEGIEAYFDEGANLVTFRGQAVLDWWEPFGGLTTRPSGKHLPIYVSITCATGIYHMDGYPCEYVTRAGTVDNPRGGVAWIGQGRCTWYSLERSSLSKNIFAGWFEAKLQAIEAAHQYGRAVMYSEFGGSNEARIEYQSSE
ncbi:MAG TPA: hypothetical protein ENG11_03010, partial [candidate division Zixibacteria bacterium]|nr:hypothetical protein [candidate division Zixibacteria bacterium]